MRTLPLIIVVGILGTASATLHAQVMKESDCQLQYLKNVQSNHAVNLINSACNFLSGWSASMELSRNERLYNECLLRELSGVQNDQAAALVQQACRKRNSFSLE